MFFDFAAVIFFDYEYKKIINDLQMTQNDNVFILENELKDFFNLPATAVKTKQITAINSVMFALILNPFPFEAANKYIS